MYTLQLVSGFNLIEMRLPVGLVCASMVLLKQSIVIRAKQDFAKKFFILLNSMQI
jgi:hypothetical protein